MKYLKSATLVLTLAVINTSFAQEPSPQANLDEWLKSFNNKKEAEKLKPEQEKVLKALTEKSQSITESQKRLAEQRSALDAQKIRQVSVNEKLIKPLKTTVEDFQENPEKLSTLGDLADEVITKDLCTQTNAQQCSNMKSIQKKIAENAKKLEECNEKTPGQRKVFGGLFKKDNCGKEKGNLNDDVKDLKNITDEFFNSSISSLERSEKEINATVIAQTTAKIALENTAAKNKTIIETLGADKGELKFAVARTLDEQENAIFDSKLLLMDAKYIKTAYKLDQTEASAATEAITNLVGQMGRSFKETVLGKYIDQRLAEEIHQDGANFCSAVNECTKLQAPATVNAPSTPAPAKAGVMDGERSVPNGKVSGSDQAPKKAGPATTNR